MADVFVSYASAEKEKARLVAESLEAAGFSVWWDRALKPGETFDKVIQREIEQAKAIVVLWTKASVESQWVREEADVGRQREALVPLLMDEVTPPIGFGRVQAAHLHDWSGDPKSPEWVEVVESVQRLVGRAATPVFARRRAAPTRSGGGSRRSWVIGGLVAAVVVLLGLVSILADGLKTLADPQAQDTLRAITAAQQQQQQQAGTQAGAPPAASAPAAGAPPAAEAPAQIYTAPAAPAQTGVDPYAQALAAISPAAGQLQLTARSAGLTYVCVTPQGWCPMNQPLAPSTACWCPNAYGQPVTGVTQ